MSQANVAAMVSNRLTLLLDDDMGEVQDAARKLRKVLPNDMDVDRYLSSWRSVLCLHI